MADGKNEARMLGISTQAVMAGESVTKDFRVTDSDGGVQGARVRIEFSFYAEDENGQTIDGPLDSLEDAIDACIQRGDDQTWKCHEVVIRKES